VPTLRFALAVTLLVFPPFSPGELRGQEEEVAPGKRIRVTPVRGSRFMAVVRSLSPESLVVAGPEAAAERRLALANLSRLEVSAGRSHAPWRGAAFGALGGAVVGALLGLTGDSVIFETCRRGCKVGFASVVGGIGGVFLGGALGAAIGRERWRPAAGFTPAALGGPARLGPGIRPSLGEPARVTTLSGTRISGTIARLPPDSVSLAEGETGRERTLAVRDSRRIEVVRGTRSLTDLGGALGAAAGAITGYAARSENAAGATVGTVIGAGLGVGIGLLIRRPRWVRVEPTMVGVGLGL
jgi:hypothetical protein